MKTVATEGAPRAIGPYSQAIAEGDFLFLSGQIPLDPATGELVSGGLAAGVERVFDNLQAILKSEGLGLDDVVRTTVYLLRMSDFAEMNGIYARRFGNHRPARSTVAVAELPKGAAIEIDAIARLRRQS
jgi:2-iminobutanoate/2-iminopropanoate deaminase